MIKSVTVTNYVGDKVKIVLTQDNPTHGFLIKSIDGLGPAKANINTTNFATNDGSYYNSARLEQRNIVMELLFGGIPTIEEARQNTYKYFPIKKNVELLIETDSRLLKTTGYVESNEPRIFEQQEGSQISIVCPDPYFQSAKGSQESSFFGITPMFEFPFSRELQSDDYIEFGVLDSTAIHNVLYLGDAPVGLVITIHVIGNVGGIITIINATSSESMSLSVDKIEALIDDALVDGDDIIVSTIRGNKTIRLFHNGRYYNVLGSLAIGSDWLQLFRGDNLLSYSATEGFENLRFTFKNDVLYEGV